MPWVANASVNARSRIPPSSAVTPSRPQHNSVTGAALFTPNPRLQPGRSALAARARALPHLIVAGRRLGPQIELGAVRLDLAPDSEHSSPRQSEQQQLFHDAKPFTSAIEEPAREGAARLLTLHAD